MANNEYHNLEEALTSRYKIPQKLHGETIKLICWAAGPGVSVGITNENTRLAMMEIARKIASVQGKKSYNRADIPFIYNQFTGEYDTLFDLPCENIVYRTQISEVIERRRKVAIE